MSDLVQRLFGLEGMSPGAADVRFSLAHDVPSWAWAVAVVGAAVLAGWSYWRLSGSRAGRSALAVARALTLLLIAFLAAGPRFVRQPERTEPDWVVALTDRSRSMTVADSPPVSPGGARATRDQQLRSTLAAASPTFARLAKERQLAWMGFDAGAYAMKTDASGALPDLGEPAGRRTDLGRSIEQALQRLPAKPIAGIVVFSDGRSPDAPTRQLLRRLESERIPVFVVPLGSADPLADLALVKADAPKAAFINDLVPVNVEVERRGPGPPPARVQLIDDTTKQVLDEQRLEFPDAEPATAGVTANSARARLTLSARPDTPGKESWTVRVLPDAPDLSAENNAATLAVELVDRPIRVVYFDGYPRWEFQYLKGLLVREKSITSSILLLSADKQYTQEGTRPLASLPASPGEWASIDVVVLGDVRSELFSDEQLRQLREHVAVRGGGLIWMGGPAATPSSYRSRPLADLLPFTDGAAPGAPTRTGPGSAASGTPAWAVPVLLTPAPVSRTLGLLALGDAGSSDWPRELSDPRMGWPMLRWAQKISRDQLKPSAETLAWAVPAADSATPTTDAVPETSADARTPAVITMRFGAGRVVYVATDEIWRWRYGRGEPRFERFWLPLIRFAARESLARTGKPALVEITPERATVDQPVRVAVKLLDQALIDSRGPSETMTAKLTPRDTPDRRAVPTPVTLTRESSGVLAGTAVLHEPGEYTLDLTDPLFAGLGLSASVTVVTPEDEMRTPQADHAALAELAKATGGKILSPAELDQLPTLLPNRQLRILGTPEIRTLWDRPIVLIALMVLLSSEWLGRKWLRLA